MKKILSWILILIFIFSLLLSTNQVYGSQENIRAFVARLYNLCLDRQPDINGLEYWTRELITNKRTGADVVYHFIFSDEFLNKNLSGGEYIDVLYKVFFDREADVAGKNFWQNKLNFGYSRKYILANFVNSEEFIKICQDSNIAVGSIEIGNEDLGKTETKESFGNPDSIFLRPDISSLTNIDNYTVKDKTIYFSTEKNKNYKLQETLNRDINRQVYELTKNLITDGLYVRVIYFDYDNEYVSVMLAANEILSRWSSDIFTFYFQEKEVDPYGNYNAYIDVSMSDLIYEGVDHSPKLKIGFITVFGEEEGTKLFNFAYDCFNKYGSWEDRKKEIRLTKEFDTVIATYVQQGRFFTNDCGLLISKK